MLHGALQFHIKWVFQENMYSTDEVFPRMTFVINMYTGDAVM